MGINFDLFSDERFIDLPAGAGGYGHRGNAPLDWTGLAARLAVAHAASQILASGHSFRCGLGSGRGSEAGTNCSAPASGSFAPALAPAIAAYRANASRQADGFTTSAINQDAKATGNPPGTISGDSKGNANA